MQRIMLAHRGLLIALPMLALLAAAGCQSTKEAEAPPKPPPTYRGPAFLRGTLGSLASLEGHRPRLVSGYGLVVGLDGTGSSDVPPALRQWLMDLMAKRGFGRYETGYRNMTPANVLASKDTAVVRVAGVIPAGAPKGTRFDLRVTALPQTQTTSLEGGRLYSTDLRPGGTNLGRPQAKTIAKGGPGDVFLDPVRPSSGGSSPEASSSESGDDSNSESSSEEDREALLRGRVLAGGVTREAMPLRLVTNRTSYRLTTQIADRINGRYRKANEPPLAEAKSNTVVALNVPDRFRDNTQHMLDLLSHLYLNPRTDFAEHTAKRMAERIRKPENREYAGSIAYVWQGLGQAALPEIRPLYDAEAMEVRMAALQAGARLGDTKAADPLYKIAGDPEHEAAERATGLLTDLLIERPRFARVTRMLRKLVDSDAPRVRIAAFEGLAEVEDSTVRRYAFSDKLELAQVQCEKPMIYVTRTGRPRVVIFDDQLPFQYPLMFEAWDHRFMLRGSEGQDQIGVFYQRSDRREPTKERVPARLPYLVMMMAFDPDQNEKGMGLDMSYSRIVRALHLMTEGGAVDAPLVLQRTTLDERIEQRKQDRDDGDRPETAANTDGRPATSAPGAASDESDSQENMLR